jgi:hypothetical protein
MGKQKAAKRKTKEPVIKQEQPGGYKKIMQDDQESYSRLRNNTDAIRAAAPRY